MRHRLYIPHGKFYMKLDDLIAGLNTLRSLHPEGNVWVSLDGEYPTYPDEKTPEDVGLVVEWTQPDTPEMAELSTLSAEESRLYCAYDQQAEAARNALRSFKSLAVPVPEETCAALQAILDAHDQQMEAHEAVRKKVVALEDVVAEQERDRGYAVHKALGLR